MSYEHRKQVIEDWLICHNNNLGEIPRFLDDVVLHLWTNKFDPTDPGCQFESFAEAEEYHINELKNKHGYIISTIPLEVLFMYAYTHVEECYLPEYIFDDNFKIEEVHTFTGLVNRYTKMFHPKLKRLLIHKLGVKKLMY